MYEHKIVTNSNVVISVSHLPDRDPKESWIRQVDDLARAGEDEAYKYYVDGNLEHFCHRKYYEDEIKSRQDA